MKMEDANNFKPCETPFLKPVLPHFTADCIAEIWVFEHDYWRLLTGRAYPGALAEDLREGVEAQLKQGYDYTRPTLLITRDA